MIAINKKQVEDLSKQLNSKQTYGKNDTALYPIFSHAQINLFDMLRELSTFEIAHWTNYSDRFCIDRNSKANTTGYPRGTIVFVDLGAGNFGHEPSFTHPAIVLDQKRESLLIAPCSSKKYQKGYPEIIDATPQDGFLVNTGIQTNSIRWISKNRVISVIGKTTSDILNQIDAHLLKSIPLHKKQLIEKDKIIAQLQSQINSLSKNHT